MSGQAEGPLDCAAAVRQLWDYLDEKLTPDRVILVKEHLDTCANCFKAAEIQREILRRVRDTAGSPDDPSLQALERSIRELIRRHAPG